MPNPSNAITEIVREYTAASLRVWIDLDMRHSDRVVVSYAVGCGFRIEAECGDLRFVSPTWWDTPERAAEEFVVWMKSSRASAGEPKEPACPPTP